MAAAVLGLFPAWALAQTAPLNDTGQTQCYDAANTAGACSAATTGNTGARPGQDGRFGRDAAQAAGALPAKTGGGVAGFDFTALDASGATTTPGTHQCVKDNVTGLVWSTETLTPMTWAAAGTAGASYTRCGTTTGWRLPTRRELLSIVHYGASTVPSIDSTYFPATQSNGYWTSGTYVPNPAYAWIVNFNSGNTYANIVSNTLYVRLVRSGQ